jgi:gliding motility-associated-like protein
MSKHPIGGLAVLGWLFLTLCISSTAIAAPPRPQQMYISGSTAGTTLGSNIVKNYTAMKVGHTLRAYYTYGDADGNPQAGAPEYQWYTYDDNLGTNPQPIGGATAVTFAITAAQQGKHIAVRIRVRNVTDNFGPFVEYRPWNGATLNPVYADGFSCFRPTGSGVPVPGNLILSPSASQCSPRSLIWQVQYTGINWRNNAGGNQSPKIIINWGDNVTETLDPRMFNPISGVYDVGLYNAMASGADTLALTNMLLQNWRVEQPHTYDYAVAGRTPSVNPERCTYTMTTTWGVGIFGCLAQSSQTQKFAVWDTEANANLGTRDMGHVTGTGGFESGEVTLICPFDRTAIRIEDDSDFNCTLGGAHVETPNPNDQARWVQYVYGTTNTMSTGAGATEKITINGVDYTAAQLPVYGPVVYLPAAVTTPNAQTFDIRVPTSATATQSMRITMRTWNTCAPFDRNVLDANGLNPTQGGANNVFSIYDPLGSAPGPLGGPPFFAHNAPALTFYDITITNAPAPPTVTYTANHCDTDANNTFTFTTTHTQANSTLRWYRDALLTDVDKSHTTSNTFNPITEGSPAMVKAAASETKVISYYVTEQWPGANGCTSQPQTMTFNITDTNNGGAIDHPNEIGVTEVVAICTGTNPAAFTSTTAATGGTGTPAYQWERSTTSAIAGFADIVGATLATYDPPATATTAWFRRRVSSGFCADAYSNVFQIRVDVAVTAGSIGNGQTLCANVTDPTAITSTGAGGGGTGTPTYSWQFSTDNFGADINPVVGINTATYDPGPLAVTTWFRRINTSGVCVPTFAITTPVVMTVQPTIVPGTISSAQIICSGIVPATLTGTASTGGLAPYAYQWERSVTSAVAGFANAPGVSTGIDYSPPALTQTTWYRRRTSGGICASQNSNVIQITVNPLPTASVTGGGSACSGTAANDIEWTITGTGPFNFTITATPPTAGFPINEVGYASNSYTIVAPNPAGTTNYQMTVLRDANTCDATPLASMGGPRAVNVILIPPPTVDSFTAQAAVCNDGAGTNPPNAILDLAPNSVQNYTISYRMQRISDNSFVPGTITVPTVTSDVNGVVSLEPTYAQFGAAPTDPQGYRPVIVAIQNTTTLCAGAVPINGPTLIINARPAAPTNAVPGVVCSTSATGAPISVTAPAAGLNILWSTTTAPTFTAATGVSSGVRNSTFTPASNLTQTYHAFTENTVTSCRSAASLSVSHTRDLIPTAAAGGPDQPSLCITSATMAATAVDNGGTGTWTLVGAAIPGLVITSPNSPTTTVTGLPQNAPGGAAIVTTLRWTATSALVAQSGCAASFDDVPLTVNALPAATNLTPILCEDVFGGGSHSGFDLTTLNATVTGGVPGITVEWFANPIPASPIIPANTPQTITNGAGGTFFFRLTSGIPCQNIGTVTFTVRTLPAKVDQSVQICENSPPGSLEATGINLQSYETAIANGSMVNRNIEWYEDALLTTLIPAGAALGAENNYRITADRTIFAKIIDTTPLTPQCFRTAQLALDYQPRPTANQISDGIGQVLGATYTVCASSNLVLLQINPGNNPGSTITWTVPPPSYAGEFELLTGTSGFFIILRFENPIPGAGTLYPTGVPISVRETLGTALCAGTTINTRIVVEGAPPKPIIAGPSSVCSNANGLVFTVTNPVAGTYSWSLPAGATITSLPVTASSITVQMSTFSGNVTVTHASGTGCTSPAADPFAVAVINRPIIGSPASATICSGESVQNEHSIAANIVGTTFNWEVINVTGSVTGTIFGDLATGTTGINQTITNTSGFSASVTYRVTPVGPAPDNCPGNPQNLTITVNPQPVIVAGQTKSICSGDQVNKEILLAPINLPAGTLFNWPDPDGPGLASAGNNVPMGAAGTLHITDVLVNTTNAPIVVNYVVTPTSGSACPGAPVTIAITVNPEPEGVAQTLTRCSDELVNATLGVAVTSAPAATYNITVVSNGLIFTGTTASAGNGKTDSELADDKWTNTGLVPVNVTYTIRPVTAVGCIGDPFTVVVTVNPEPVGSAATATRCSNEVVNFGLTTSGTSVAAATFNIATNSNGLVQNAGTVSAGNGKAANELVDDVWTNNGLNPVNVVYTITPVSAALCEGNPYTVTITVRPSPAGANSAESRCSDELVNVTISTDVTAVAAASYNISINPNGLIFSGTTPSAGNGKLANELLDDRWTNTGLASVNVEYSIVPVSSASCAGDPFTITVTVRPEPVGSNSSTTICSDEVLGLTLSTSATAVAAANYTIAVNANGLLQSAGTNSAGANKLANELADDVWRNTGLAAATVVYTITPFSAAGCAGNVFTVSVTVNPEPVGNNSTTTICGNSAVAVTLSTNPASVAAATYNIAINPNGLTQASGTLSTGTGKLATEIADDVWTNIGLGPVNVIYTVTPVSADLCAGDPFTVTVTVNPQPVGSSMTITRCSDTVVGVPLTTSATAVAASSYNITTANGGLTQSAGTASAGNGKAANELVDDVWRNTGLVAVDVVYTIRPVSAAGCIGDPFTITATVDPEPVGANSTATRCSDEILGITLTTNVASVAASTYNIALNANGLALSAGTASAGTGKAANEIADDVWRNTGLSPVNVVYTITPVSAALCEGNSFTVTVTVNPEPVGANSTASKCSDEVLGINITTSATAVAVANYTIAVNPNGLTQVAGTNSAGSNKTANEISDDVWRNTTNAAVDVVYTITPISAAPCAGDDFTITVTINPEPIGVAQTPTRCSDELVNVTLGVTGASVAATAYNIAVNANGLIFSGVSASNGTGKAANELVDDRWTNTGLLAVQVTYTINPVSGTCVGDVFTVIVTVDPEPVGATGTATRCSDELVNFALVTSGTSVAAANFDIATNANGLTQSAGTVSAGTGKLANELLDDMWTNNGLNPVNVVYTVIPYSAAGCAGNSFTVTVTVRPEPVGTPASVALCSDELVGVSIGTDLTAVAATSFNIAINANGLIFSGTTASAGIGKLANELMDDRWTNTGLVPVNVDYTITPISSQLCAGDPFVISVTVRPEPVGANSVATFCSDVVLGINLTTSATAVAAANYTIAINPNGLLQSAGTSSAGSNKLANEIADDVWRNTGLTATDVIYTITPISAAGCAGNNFTVTITVNPEPVGSNSTTTVCANDPVSVSLSTNPASVAAATYNIAINPNGLILASGTPSAGTGKLAAEISDDVWANTGLGPVNVIYTITPVSAGPANCSGDPFTVTVTVNPQPVGSNVTATRCSDVAAGVTLSTSITAVPASSYNITTVNGGLTQVAGTVSAGNGKAANELADDVWRNTGLIPVDVVYTVRAVSAPGCIGDPFTVTITVNPEPVGVSSTITRCSDNLVGVTLTTNAASVAADTYTIAVVANGLTLSAGTASAGVGKAANEIADDVWRNTGLNPVDVIYTIIPVSAALCDGNAFTVTVTVDPEPVGSTSTANKCSDEVLNITLTTAATAVAAANYTIAVNANGLTQVGGTNSAGPGKAASEIADDVWRNLTNAPVNVVYTITPRSGANCAGDDFTITVTINPEPIGVDQTPTRCSDELVNVTLGVTGASVAATTYEIAIVANGLAFSGTSMSAGIGKLANELVDDRWTNTGLTPVNVEYTIIPVSGALCQGNPFTVTVTVNPEPVGTNSTATRCSDELVSVNLSTSATAVAAATYEITINSNGLVFSGTTPSAGIGKLLNELADDRWTNDGLIPVNVIYTITPVSAAGCPGDPFTVNVTVRPEPVGFDSVVEVCSDQAVGFPLSTDGGSVAAQSYTIAVNANGLSQSGGTPSAGSGKAAGEIAADVWRNTGLVAVDVVYTIIPVSAAPALCQGDPFTVTVTVNPEPVGAPIITDRCSDEVLGITLTTNATSVATDSYNITVNSNGLVQSAGTPSAGLNMADNEIADDAWRNTTTAAVAVVYTITPVTAAPESCEGDSFTITVTINPEPVGQNVNITDCSTTLNYNIQVANINALGNGLPSVFTYVVTSSDEIAVPTPPALDRSVANNNPITDSFNNTSSAAVDVTYMITPFNSAEPTCGGTPFFYRVRISPKPVGVSNTKAAVCSDVAFNFNPQNDLSPSVTSTFTWTVAYDPGITVRLAKSPQADNIAETLTNTTTGPLNAVYTVIPTASGSSCVGDPFVITVPINPEPVVAGGDVTQCSDVAYGLALNTVVTSVGAMNYDISAVVEAGLTGVATTGATMPANALMADVFTNHTAAQLRVTYTVTPRAASGCLGDPKEIVFRVNPEPVLAPLTIPDICSSNLNNPSVTNIVLGTNGTSINAQSYRLEVLEYRYVGDPAYSAAPPAGFSFPASNKVITNTGNANVVRNDAFTNVSNRTVEVKYTFLPFGPLPQSCPGDPMDFVIRVNPQPTLDPALSPTPICSDSPTSVTLGVDPGPPASIAATTFIIRSISFPGLTAGPTNAGTGTGKLANAIFNDTYTNTTSVPLDVTYTVAPVSALGCVGLDESFIVRVNPAPAVKSGLDRVACNDAQSNIVLQDNAPSSVAASTYEILSVTVGGLPIAPGATVGGLTANAANAALGITADVNVIRADRFVNTTTDRIIVSYTVVPISAPAFNSCRGPAKVITLTIEPQVVSASVNATPSICSGDAVNITFASPTYANLDPTNPVVTFSYATLPASVSGTTVGNNLSEGIQITDVLVNTTNNPITVTYRITPRAANAANGIGCPGTFQDVTVVVEPRPRITAIPNKTICEGTSVDLSLVSTTVPSAGTIKIFVTATADPEITGFTNNVLIANNTILGDVLVNSSASIKFVTYHLQVRNVDGADAVICSAGAPIDVVVGVSPGPIITPIPDFAICSGDSFDPIPIITDTETAVPGSTLITWAATTNGNVSGESNGAGNLFSQVLFNSTNDKQTVIYNISATNINGTPPCLSTPPTQLRVTVYPNPRVVGLPSSANVCNNGTLSPNPYVLTPSTVPALGTTFDWVVDNGANPDLPVIGNGVNQTAINQTFINNGSFLGTQQYTITAHLTMAAGDNPLIDTSITDNVCGAQQDAVIVVNVAPPVSGDIYGFDIEGNQTDEIYLCRGAKQFVYIDPIGLPLMEASYSENGVTKTLTKLGGLNVLQVSPANTSTFELLSVKDKFGCVQTINKTLTVNVDEVDNTFSIVGPAIACSPFHVTFQHNQVAGTSYTWKWLDGPDSTTYNAASSVAGQNIRHTYTNPSPGSTARFRASLDAFLDTTQYLAGCRKKPVVVEVRVYPTVSTAVFADKEVICSDESVAFTNASQGVVATGHRWFYRVAGSTTELDVKTTANVTFKIPNTTSTNPIVYEVVYQATNGNCPAAEVVTPVTVYRGVDAHFSHTTPTLYEFRRSTMTFTNDSAPVDGVDFRYEWDFGLDANPATVQGVGPFDLVYITPGPKEVTLIATNILAEAVGLTCADQFTEIINILVPPLLADFTAIPLEACFPTDITITENKATGDTYAWRMLDNAGVAGQSNAELPVFKVPSPGKYTIELVTSNSFTGDQKTATKDIIIYDLPMASFDIRPGVVYVPDTELNTYNFSDGATSYLWDFDDGTTSDEKEPTHKYRIEGVYDVMLIAMNDHGNNVVCVDTLVRKITAKQGGVTRVPNAFTPNPNGPTSSVGTPGIPGSNTFNDVFLPQVKGAEEFNMQVFDRWGNLVFESNNSNVGWDGYNKDGKLMPAGVYVYKLTLRLSDGQRTTQVGDITMIR